MEFQRVIARRRMVRRYSPEPVPQSTIDRLLTNAVRAPSAGFSQGWSFLVLDSREDVDRFWASSTPPQRAAEPDSWLQGMRQAPLVIVLFSSRDAYLRRYAEPDKGWNDGSKSDSAESRWPVPYWHIDTGMASLLILLTAVDEQLGACFFGIPTGQVSAVCHEFGVPHEWTPIGAITVGYPAADERVIGSARSRRRKEPHEVVHRGHWSQ